MRSLAFLLPASLMLVTGVQAQSLTEHAAAAAGATIGTAAGKSLSNSLTKIFGDTDKQTAKAAKPDTKKATKPLTNPAASDAATSSKRTVVSGSAPALFEPSPSSSPSQPRNRARRPSESQYEAAAAVNAIGTAPVIAEPVVKVPTAEEVASIQVGTSESDLMAALGQPAARVTIPDDDGHLREICQYWANGRALGTIRLDNGQVVTVEARREN